MDTREYLYISTIGILVIVIVYLMWTDVRRWILGFSEGFAGSGAGAGAGANGLVSVGKNNFFAKYFPRRGDVGPEQEENGYVADPRYYQGYVDVQGLGADADFCRMVAPVSSLSGSKSDDKGKFFACALAGTEGLSSVSYRTPSVLEGFQLGRDDYMRDIQGKGLSSYCRILKEADGSFRAQCNVGEVKGFRGGPLVPDNEPPASVERLLNMYAGCVSWLRMFDDLVDYAGNLRVSKGGTIGVEEDVEAVKEVVKQGVYFNGYGFLRIGDNAQLEFGNVVLPQNIRCTMAWVKFEEFTNNAHVFDFGDGAGINNVWLGILGRGDMKTEIKAKYQALCGTSMTDVLPEPGAGTGSAAAEYVEEVTPQVLLEKDLTTCTGFTVDPVEPDPVRVMKLSKKEEEGAQSASLVYEIWERDDRKMRVVIPGFFLKGVWTHVVVAALDDDPYRPDLAFYRNGVLMHVQPSAWLPQKNELTRNYIGRTNWLDATNRYANKSELFKGYMADFRMYNTVVEEEVIQDSYKWGAEKLGL
jgi:hypothetical protein